MNVAKVIEIIAESEVGFDDAIKQGVARASDSVSDITGAWVKEQNVKVENGKIVEYQVILKVTFIVKDKMGQTTR